MTINEAWKSIHPFSGYTVNRFAVHFYTNGSLDPFTRLFIFKTDKRYCSVQYFLRKVGIMSRDQGLTMLWMRVCVYHDTEVSVLVSCSRREQRGVVQQLRQQFSRFVKMFFIPTESALFVHTQQGVHLTLVTCRDPKRWAAERTGNYTGSRKERKQPRTHRAEAGFSSTELWPLVWHSARYVCHNSTSPIPVDKHKHFLIKTY